MALVYHLAPRTRFILSFLLVVAAIGIACYSPRQSPKYSIYDRVDAEPYEWPLGCPALDYRTMSKIPKRCTRVRRYRLQNYTELGLGVSVDRSNHWFRVGDDALLLDCSTWGKQCVIKDHVADKFGIRRLKTGS